MLRSKIIACVAVLGGAVLACDVQAQSPGFGFQPFGFYQPYGVRYRSSTPTPPYFAINPPVYYGTRHFRPYGISPFAAPPQVGAPNGYQGQAGPSGLRQRHYAGPVGNPFICRRDSATEAAIAGTSPKTTDKTLVARKPVSVGRVQSNPFVHEDSYFAQR